MGPNQYALTWHIISNYVGLDISAKGYQKGAYTLCALPPTARRMPPIKNKIERHDEREGSSSSSELVRPFTGSVTEAIEPNLSDTTAPTDENNVFIPLPHVKTPMRIVGVKGKSGITKTKTVNHNAGDYSAATRLMN